MAHRDLDQAAALMGAYATLEARWALFLKERSNRRLRVERPELARPSRKWWYTKNQATCTALTVT